MSATNSTTSAPSAGPAVLKSLLLLIVGAGAGYLACWYAKVGPAVAHAGSLESEVRSLTGERDAERTKMRDSESANEQLRTGATAASKERETMLRDLQISRESEANLKKELATHEEVVKAKVEDIAKVTIELEASKERCAMLTEQRDELARTLQQLGAEAASPEPVQLAPVEPVRNASPSALARRAQSAEVRDTLAPLFAKGLYQPLREPSADAKPFSLRAIADSGALDRGAPESLDRLWRIVTAPDTHREDQWPRSWEPLDAPGWVETWFRMQADGAIPVLDNAQRLLIELGPTLVELRMLAP